MSASGWMVFRGRAKASACVAVVAAMLAGCGGPSRTETAGTGERAELAELIPHVVTADIQSGIERHIEERTRLGGGYFTLPFEGGELRLKLVRVHTEYLSNLGPRRHFACVDLVDVSGDVYDVDFFLAGDPGSMTVTETTVHKRNGKPFYVWRQKRDRTWERVAVDDASRELLGVVEGLDRFEFVYLATLPDLDGAARMWIPLPATDGFQSVEVREIEAPGQRRILTDERFGNQVLFLELEPGDSGKSIVIRADVERREKAAYRDEQSSPESFLAPERLMPIDERFRGISETILAGKESELVRARALYDHTIDHMRYIKYGDFGRGDAQYACDVGTGNCTEFHSYFISLARSAGIPARFAIGAAIPSERDDGGIDGYHCWAEFYAEGRWWPVDISEADKYSALATYYFGRHPANRVELSRGRDIVVEPGPKSGPINFLAYPVLEVDGKPVSVKTRFGFRRLAETDSAS